MSRPTHLTLASSSRAADAGFLAAADVGAIAAELDVPYRLIGRNAVTLLVAAQGVSDLVPARETADADFGADYRVVVAGHPRIDALRGAFGRWSANRDRPVDHGFPVARFLLLHTLSHLLIRQVALECGYGSSSIRERLYVGTPAEPATDILLSTAASDSEGTLGGLVALGTPVHLKRLLDNAVDEARRCSSDPLCAEHVPYPATSATQRAAQPPPTVPPAGPLTCP